MIIKIRSIGRNYRQSIEWPWHGSAHRSFLRCAHDGLGMRRSWPFLAGGRRLVVAGAPAERRSGRDGLRGARHLGCLVLGAATRSRTGILRCPWGAHRIPRHHVRLLLVAPRAARHPVAVATGASSPPSAASSRGDHEFLQAPSGDGAEWRGVERGLVSTCRARCPGGERCGVAHRPGRTLLPLERRDPALGGLHHPAAGEPLPASRGGGPQPQLRRPPRVGHDVRHVPQPGEVRWLLRNSRGGVQS